MTTVDALIQNAVDRWAVKGQLQQRVLDLGHMLLHINWANPKSEAMVKRAAVTESAEQNFVAPRA